MHERDAHAIPSKQVRYRIGAALCIANAVYAFQKRMDAVSSIRPLRLQRAYPSYRACVLDVRACVRMCVAARLQARSSPRGSNALIQITRRNLGEKKGAGVTENPRARRNTASTARTSQSPEPKGKGTGRSLKVKERTTNMQPARSWAARSGHSGGTSRRKTDLGGSRWETSVWRK